MLADKVFIIELLTVDGFAARAMHRIRQASATSTGGGRFPEAADRAIMSGGETLDPI